LEKMAEFFTLYGQCISEAGSRLPLFPLSLDTFPPRAVPWIRFAVLPFAIGVRGVIIAVATFPGNGRMGLVA